MVTIHRAQGLRFIIFVDDHEPAHVHVFGDGHIKINLISPDGRPRVVTIEGMKRSDVRKALQVVIEQQLVMLSRWEDIHG